MFFYRSESSLFVRRLARTDRRGAIHERARLHSAITFVTAPRVTAPASQRRTHFAFVSVRFRPIVEDLIV